jgi:hypothetical protein
MHGVTESKPVGVNFFMQPPCFYFPKIKKHTSLYGPIASGASVGPTSQVCSSNMLVSPIVENWKVRFWDRPPWHTKFHLHSSSGSRVKSCEQTGPAPYAFNSCISCKEHVRETIISFQVHTVFRVSIYSVTQMTWNPLWQRVAAAANELQGN